MTRRGLFVSLLGGLLAAPSVAAAGRRTRALRYGEDRRQIIRFHAPRRANGLPVLVMFGGDGVEAARTAQSLAERGFVVALAELRTVQGRRVIADAALATVWTAAWAETFGGDATRLAVLGLGPGADPALMIALDRRYMAAFGRPDLIRVAVSCGRSSSEPVSDPTLTRPEAYVRADAPPVWLTGGGEADAALAARIRAVGGRVEINAGRSGALKAMADALRRALDRSPW